LPTSIRRRPAIRTRGRAPLPNHRRPLPRHSGVLKVGISTYTRWKRQLGIRRKGSGRPPTQIKAQWVKGIRNTSILWVRTSSWAAAHLAGHSEWPPVAASTGFVKQFFASAIPSAIALGFPVRTRPSGWSASKSSRGGRHHLHSVYLEGPRHVFSPLTQARRNPPDDDPETHRKRPIHLRRRIVIQTAHPWPAFEKIVADHWRASTHLTIVKFQTFQQQIDDRFIEERSFAHLTSLFGLLALLPRRHRPLMASLRTPSCAAPRRSASAWA